MYLPVMRASSLELQAVSCLELGARSSERGVLWRQGEVRAGSGEMDALPGKGLSTPRSDRIGYLVVHKQHY